MPKAQHGSLYRPILALLRQQRETAGLSQRELGTKLRRPQSWIYNCESGNRRVDIGEFVAWCKACGTDPHAALDQVMGGAVVRRTGGQKGRSRGSGRPR
jgi:transcriptional regulator with XRE-family HTH domain